MIPIKLISLLFGFVYSKPSIYQVFPTFYEQLAFTPQTTNILHNVKSQFHAQDELGQYTYGYNDGLSSKIESKTADGITQGSYAYVDSNGIIQNVNYVSDDINGFRVSASNLPSVSNYHLPILEKISAPETSYQIAVNGIEVNPTIKSISLETTKNYPKEQIKNVTTKPNITKIHDEVPIVRLSEPVTHSITSFPSMSHVPSIAWYPNEITAAIPLDTYKSYISLTPTYSQFHSQDELGQYSYGFSGGPVSKVETKTSDGVTRGEYSYIDANGIEQKVNYIADSLNGFRATGTNLPVSNIPNYYIPQYYLPQLSSISYSDSSKEID